MHFDWSLTTTFCIFIATLIALFFVSKITIQLLFQLLRLWIKNDHTIMYLISLLFLPGTIIHELSHFVMAMILFLPVHDLRIFPDRRGNDIKLGHVIYEKRDVFRGILVGIAPVIVGLLFFWWLYSINMFSDSLWYIRMMQIYITFVVSTTMFSSRQDMVDIVYIIPVILIIGFCVYYFNIDIHVLAKNKSVVAVLRDFMYSVTVYCGISFIIHLSLITIFKLVLTIHKKWIL